ncbi:hypothetical protein LEP1GSC116_4981 [Leptospira interrogans serovar Icterohaemorrhagiae str. Verdun HP]|uniref:Uncharacterized protein n=1 Tax=Leptospira interrogans serovar Icterohaemorrhagiae str. Verdun HP TaxID=1049910 RepID=M6RG38_LEPIR|nr:hypothetical protein LEP1GSC116_4981 [Leptospira interrogans serovar Icterohaemorrhagiae str. Verdun HP]
MIADKEQDFSDVRTELIQKVFQFPGDAFDLYQKIEGFGYFEILKTHFLLWILAPVAKILSNFFFRFFRLFDTKKASGVCFREFYFLL